MGRKNPEKKHLEGKNILKCKSGGDVMVSGGDFPGGPMVKNSSANAGGMGLMPGLGRFHTPWGN